MIIFFHRISIFEESEDIHLFDYTKLNNRLSLISQTSFMLNAQTFTHLAKNGISVVKYFVISVFILYAV